MHPGGFRFMTSKDPGDLRITGVFVNLWVGALPNYSHSIVAGGFPLTS